MKLISKTNGAVFYVDILGIEALTNSRIKLSEEDYIPWLDQYHEEYTEQFLAAAILAEFRKILIGLKRKFKHIKISQFSDCAFIWSENITDIVLFASNFMTQAVTRGLLCRGGLSYGEIIEANRNNQLGRFIVGKAVTVAAKLEGISKGVRILIDQDFPINLWNNDKCFAELTLPLFVPFVNPINYETYDEFKWYLHPNLNKNVGNLSILSSAERVRLTKERLKIANNIRCSPKFSWNSKSEEGLVHIRASIQFISSNKLLGISHDFEWETEMAKRDNATVNRVCKVIDEIKFVNNIY